MLKVNIAQLVIEDTALSIVASKLQKYKNDDSGMVITEIGTHSFISNTEKSF